MGLSAPMEKLYIQRMDIFIGLSILSLKKRYMRAALHSKKQNQSINQLEWRTSELEYLYS